MKTGVVDLDKKLFGNFFDCERNKTNFKITLGDFIEFNYSEKLELDFSNHALTMFEKAYNRCKRQELCSECGLFKSYKDVKWF